MCTFHQITLDKTQQRGTQRPARRSPRAVENVVHVNDLHATLLPAVGLNHTQLTYRYAGRDFRLTDVGGNVATDIFA